LKLLWHKPEKFRDVLDKLEVVINIANMPITILQPTAATERNERDDDASDSDSDGGAGLGRRTKRTRNGSAIVTPGEVITEDSQWMR
jgi:hypothetical protein